MLFQGGPSISDASGSHFKNRPWKPRSRTDLFLHHRHLEMHADLRNQRTEERQKKRGMGNGEGNLLVLRPYIRAGTVPAAPGPRQRDSGPLCLRDGLPAGSTHTRPAAEAFVTSRPRRPENGCRGDRKRTPGRREPEPRCSLRSERGDGPVGARGVGVRAGPRRTPGQVPLQGPSPPSSLLCLGQRAPSHLAVPCPSGFRHPLLGGWALLTRTSVVPIPLRGGLLQECGWKGARTLWSQGILGWNPSYGTAWLCDFGHHPESLLKAHQWVVKKLLDGALMSMSTANQKRSFLS